MRGVHKSHGQEWLHEQAIQRCRGRGSEGKGREIDLGVPLAQKIALALELFYDGR
jgi:hypothetical protein